jgi:prepilin-type N-terminal cleavage/methylation domain-containing protein
MSVTRPHQEPQAGFTLVELLVVTLILGVVGSIVVGGIVSVMRSTQETQSRTEAMAELQIGVERATRELRAANCQVEGFDQDELTVEVGRPGERQQHTFAFEGGELRHSLHDAESGTDVFVDRVLVRDLADDPGGFEYFEDFDHAADGGEAATSASELHLIRITMRRDLDQGPPIEVETVASPRNGGRSCA